MIEKQIFDRLLSRLQAGGVEITYADGTTKQYGPDKPYFGLKFKSSQALRNIIKNQSLGLGEGYMNGDIEIEGNIDQIVRLVAENRSAFNNFSLQRLTHRNHLNITSTQAKLVQHHYDLGNAFYKLWLDKSLTYSCAYFKTPEDSLEQAQKQKVDHLLRKLQLQKGQSLLDIGSGWGTLLITAAKEYGVTGLGVTLSKQQHELSNKRVKEEGLEGQIKFELVNYEDLAKRDLLFDRIISVGMFEHVGKRNHAAYYKTVQKLLVPGGISVLHTISNQFERQSDAWIDKYIFPGGYIPSNREVTHDLPEYGMRLLDYENLRMHYAMTLDEWLRRFEAHKDEVAKMYDERFVRMWRFYLACSSGSFRYGNIDLSQFVFASDLNNELPLTRGHLYK